jgi:hypothetical protein
VGGVVDGDVKFPPCKTENITNKPKMNTISLILSDLVEIAFSPHNYSFHSNCTIHTGSIVVANGSVVIGSAYFK